MIITIETTNSKAMSQVRWVGYWGSSEIGGLTVTYRNGSTYIYDDVPSEVISEMLIDGSFGRSVNEKVKPYYAFHKA